MELKVKISVTNHESLLVCYDCSAVIRNYTTCMTKRDYRDGTRAQATTNTY